jgi:histidyl-tRNA synthetase
MIQAIRGTKDILPESIYIWQFLQNKFKEVSAQFGYYEYRTPIMESTEVFSRSIGEETDIVNKEMYTFRDKGDESITLRPEATAAIVRSVIQNNVIQQNNISKIWYFGPFFRYERPQKGRLRQFHQFGSECLGAVNPESDAENIMLADAVLKAIGINEYKLIINTLGNDSVREKYRNVLIDFLKIHKDELSEDSQRRLEINPLRVLDSKDERDRKIVENAPIILDSLDEDSKNHFNGVLKLLEDCSIKYEISPRLVRGLDYYCHTVFEFQSSALGAQDSLGGGGRYNGLFEQLGGKATSAVGFAMGVERLILILEAINNLPEPNIKCDYYVAVNSQNYTSNAFQIAKLLRNKGFNVLLDLARRSFKAQFKEANKINAKFTLIIGDDEIAGNYVTIKNMAEGSQSMVNYNELEKL